MQLVIATGAVGVLTVMPKLAEPPTGMLPFQEALLALTVPLVDRLFAFHIDFTVTFHGKAICQALTGVVPVLVTLTSTVRPDPQLSVVVAWMVTAAVPDCVAVGVGVSVGVGVGDAVAVGDGLVVGAGN